MSGIITSATIALTTIVTVFAAAFPELRQAIAPALESGNEFMPVCMGLLIAIPGLLLLTVIASAARE
jgi:hypothetical protein